MPTPTLITSAPADSSSAAASVFSPLPLYGLVIITFIVFIILQVSMAKKKKCSFGYIGFVVCLAVSTFLVLYYSISYALDSGGLGDPALYLVAIPAFFLLNIPSAILLAVTVVTNRKYSNRMTELEQMNISDLD